MVNRLHQNQVIAIFLGLFSIGYIIMAFDIPSFSIPRPIDSDLFPKILGFTLLVLSILLFFDRKTSEDTDGNSVENETRHRLPTDVQEGEDSFSEREKRQTFHQGRFNTPRMKVLVTLIAVTLYIFLFERLGFLLSTVLFTYGMTFYYGYKKHMVNLIVAFFVSLLFYILLTRFMGIYLPQGIIPL